MGPTKNKTTVFMLMACSLLIDAIFVQGARIDMKCNPSIRHRFEACPDGYCCVRDEYLPTYVYCRKIGKEGENCTTRDNESECPCASGFYCKPNIASSFQSLYGHCYNASLDVTTTTFTSTTTTTMPTTTTTNTITTAQSSSSIKTSDQTHPQPQVATVPSSTREHIDDNVPFPFVPIVG